MTLARLHEILQISFGWLDYHLHLFAVGRKIYSDPAFELDVPAWDESKVRLADILREEGQRLRYDYDFDDDWRHTLQLEKILPPQAAAAPVCLGGKRHRPPEDCGGPSGYARFLEAFVDPHHEEHEEMRSWG